MKLKTLLLKLTFLICLQIGTAHANGMELQEIIFNDEDSLRIGLYEENLIIENNRRQIDFYHLQKAKFKLINGDFRQAEFFLNRIDSKRSNVKAIKMRYLAMISFSEANFTQSLKYLEDPALKASSFYPEICLLRLINFMALDNKEALKEESEKCQFFTSKYSNNEQYWLNNMIYVKLLDTARLNANLVTDTNEAFKDDEASRLWLKTGLYLNKEAAFLNLLSHIPETSYQSTRVREIIAFLYLRSGNPTKALTFIDDIESANAENIRGNVRLLNKEYELAFGHFRLALQKKQDSVNSLDRAIPLAWILGQWEDGLQMLNNVATNRVDKKNKDTLRAAFLIKNKNFKEAKEELMLLRNAFQNQPPYEVNQMEGYVDLILGTDKSLNDRRKNEATIEKSCRFFDGLNCWLALQFIQWENLTKTIKRDDPIYTDKTLTIESLKEFAPIIPLEEEKTIDQSDIEELDSGEIVISPN